MLTIKLMKYGPEGRGADVPGTYVRSIAMHSAKDVYLNYDADGRAVLSWDETAITVGNQGHCAFDVAYIMNETGKTVDTIR